MPYYIPDLVSKTTCIGNTLSTFNISFSTLDTKLYELSTYTVNSVNFLSSTMISVSSILNSRVNFLSSTMIAVSSDLRTQIFNTSSDLRTQIFNTSSEILTQLNYASGFSNTQEQFLSSNIQYVSANVVNDYITQGVLTYSAGVADWDFSTIGNNAKIELFDNITLNNPTGLKAGQTGNLIVEIGVVNNSITAYGNLWTFAGNASSMNVVLSAKNVISYYYDGEHLLSNMINFEI